MADIETRQVMQAEMQRAWRRYLDLVEPMRPRLYAYCRRMTRNVWDAEDLVQDTLIRGFGRMGTVHQDITNPSTYLLRIASNLWIDRVRRMNTEKAVLDRLDAPENADSDTPGAVENGGRILMQHLAPQERAAIVLKEVFEYSAKEIAQILETTEGAIKAALHRARERLRDLPSEPSLQRRPPSHALVDRFVELFNARDTAGLADLLIDNASVEVLGIAKGHGRDIMISERGWLQRSLNGHPEWPADYNAYTDQRAGRYVYQGEPLIVLYRTREGTEALEEVWRFEEENGQVARIQDYCFCPEALRAIANDLELSFWNYHKRYPMP